MIYPKTVLNHLDGRFLVWIEGDNRAGKTLLGLDMAHEYLQVGYRYISNMTCVWNDRMPLELDENLQLNCICQLDEVGVHVRTKESIRRIIGFKGKLNTIFILTGTEAPHEDLWGFRIEPAYLFNEILRMLFGRRVTNEYVKVWRWIIHNSDPEKKDRKGLFLQTIPKAFFGIYSTLNPFNNAESLLSQFDKSLQDLHKATTGEADSIALLDLATKRAGMGETQSFDRYKVDRASLHSRRTVPTRPKGAK